MLTNSRIQVSNGAGHAVLMASVGIDDSTENLQQSARFYVYGDGRLLATSRLLGFGDKPDHLTVDIKDKQVIELVVRSAKTKDQRPVVATWGDIRLMRTSPAKALN